MHVNRVLTSLVSHYKFTQLHKSSALFESRQKYLPYAFGLQSVGPQRQTSVTCLRCFLKLQNYPDEFHNGSMLTVCCWNISRENSFGQGEKHTLRNKTKQPNQWSLSSHKGKYFAKMYLFIFSSSFQSLPGSGMSGQKGHL